VWSDGTVSAPTGTIRTETRKQRRCQDVCGKCESRSRRVIAILSRLIGDQAAELARDRSACETRSASCDNIVFKALSM